MGELSAGRLQWTDGMLYTLEAQIDQWRGYLRRRPAIRSRDVEELETGRAGTGWWERWSSAPVFGFK